MKGFAYILILFVSWQAVNAQTACDSLNKNFTGYCFKYHPNKQVSEVREYENGIEVGIWMQFDERGSLVSQVLKKDRAEANLPAYLEPDDEIVYDFVDEDASFVGGAGAMMKWILDNLRYPESTLDQLGRTTVFLSFIVEKDGSINNVQVERGISDAFDKEAKRLIRSMPKWNPAKIHGKTIRSRCRLPIKFHLN